MSGSNANGHRWSKWWWSDHQKDAALLFCGLAARGYWMEMLAVMHQACPVGHLLLNGRQPTHRQMAALARCTEKEAKTLEAELEEAGAFSRTQDGTIYSRRMVKDAAASALGQANGKAGGNPNLKPKPHGPNGTNPPEPTREGLTPPVNPPVNPRGYVPPKPSPLTQGVKLEAKREKEEEEEKENKAKILTSSLSPASVLARVAAACEAPPAGTYGAEEAPAAPPAAPNAGVALAVRTIVGKVGRKLESSGIRPAVKYAAHSVDEQIEACRVVALPGVPRGLEAAVLAARADLARRAAERMAAA